MNKLIDTLEDSGFVRDCEVSWGSLLLPAQSYLDLLPKSHDFYHIVPPEDIIWLSFDTDTTSFDVLLSIFDREVPLQLLI